MRLSAGIIETDIVRRPAKDQYDFALEVTDLSFIDPVELPIVDNSCCDFWVEIEVGMSSEGALYQVHICTPESIKRISNKRYVHVIDKAESIEKLIDSLNSVIRQVTHGEKGDPYQNLAKRWLWEYERTS